MDLYFMPSDIARLILGYLKEHSYSKTYNCFLKECDHLRELYNLEKAGRSLKRVTQLSLIKIVEEWGRYKYSSERSDAGSPTVRETPSSDDTVDDNLVFDNDVTSSGRKTKQRPRSSSKKSPHVLKTGKSPCTPKSNKTRLKSPRRTQSQNTEDKKTFKENAIQTDDGEVAEELPEASKNTIPVKDTPSKLKGHSGQINEAVSNTQVPSCQESRVEELSSVPVSDISKKTDTVVNDENREATFNRLTSDLSKNRISRNEKEVNKLVDQEDDKGGNSENKNINTSESALRNVADRTVVISDNLAFKQNSPQKSKVISQTFIKSVVEPPSESVSSVEDKCLSWMSRNENENTNNNKEGDKVTGDTERVKNKTNVTSATVVQHVKTQEGDQEKGQFEGTSSKSSGTSSTGSSKTPGVVTSSSSSEEGHTTPKKLSCSAPRNQLSVTPVKLLHGLGYITSRSPHRKKPKTPRKRASEVSPVSVVSTKSVDPSSVNPIFEKILSDHRLHEKLAETCNLVHSQIKLTNSGKEHREKSDRVQTENLSMLPAHQTNEQETVTASRSLEEILGIDHNFHTDLLSDNIDMSDPAYESLFRLFGTDRETFNEYLRKEKEKELALLEANVEELERSNHEILCANFGVSQGDAGYETQELAYSSPHHIPLGSQDLFSSQAGSHSPRTSQVTSTPCGTGVPVNFTSLLHGNELGNSPVRSSQSGFGSAVADTNASPGSVATQPFSPALSHYSEVNNPPTPHHQQHLSTYVAGSCHGNSPGGPRTPGNYPIDQYSNPATPQQSSPQHNQLMHSTPTGSVRSNMDHFHQSPIHPQHNLITNTHMPVHCSPLVKADLHPHSPFSSQSQNNMFQSATNSGLYFNSQSISKVTNQSEKTSVLATAIKGFSEHQSGYLNLLNDDSNTSVREQCTTIENTIGCISLPQPTGNTAKSDNEQKGAARKSRRKKPPVKRTEAFAHLKQILNKPLTIPNSVPLTMTAPGLHLPRTPEKRIPNEANLTFRSPGGKTLINVPVLNCEDEIDLSILGMDDNGDMESSSVVNVYDQKLDTSTQYSIAPENQATHTLVSAIQAGNTAEAVKQITQRKNEGTRPTKKSTPERKSRARKKKAEATKDDRHENHFSPTPPSSDLPVIHDGNLDPNEEVYTATIDTSIGKAATARALNFGPDVDNSSQYRKIMPKPSSETGPSVLILTSKQVINPGHNIVVNTTPVTLVQNASNMSVVQNSESYKIEEVPNSEVTPSVYITSQSATSSGKEETRTANSQNHEKEENNHINIVPDKHCVGRTPNKAGLGSPKSTHNVSGRKKVSLTLTNSSEKENQSHEENKMNDSEADKNSRKETPRKKSLRNIRTLCKKAKVNLGSALNSLEAYKVVDSAGTRSKVSQESKTPVSNSPDKLGEKEGAKDSKVGKKDVASKTCKSRKSKAGEKLKVKLPVMSHRSPRSKAKDSKPDKSVLPFYFKKKEAVVSEETSSDEDIPLSEVRKQQAKFKCKSKKQKEYKSVEIIIDSESTDGETTHIKDLQFTPRKTKMSSDEDHTPSKEILFEKIGLTPKKLLMEHDLKSPKRTNVLDVLAEWQGSPLSSRSCRQRSDTNNSFHSDKFVSPTTPRRSHAKQLFSSLENKNTAVKVTKKAKQTAKRVDRIIDRLRQNNPGRNLAGSRQNSSDSNKCSEINGDKYGKDESVKEESRRPGKNNKKQINKDTVESVENISENKMTKDEHIETVIDEPVFDNVTEGNVGSPLVEENEKVVDNDEILVDSNSQDAYELDRAVASIEFNQHDAWVEQEKVAGMEDEVNCAINEDTESYSLHGDIESSDNVPVKFCDKRNVEAETVVDFNREERAECVDNDNTEQNNVNSEHDNSEDNASADEHVNNEDRTIAVEHDNREDNASADEHVNNEDRTVVVEHRNTERIINSEERTVNSEHSESRSKRRKKKHKHRHRHRHSKHTDGELTSFGGESSHHHHHKKKKKSKKRHREDGEEGPESKRRKKEKPNTSVEMESLAAINIDEAITKIYGT